MTIHNPAKTAQRLVFIFQHSSLSMIRQQSGPFDFRVFHIFQINATDFPRELGKIKTEKVKLFNTIEEMNISTDNKNEDLAIVYGLNKTSVKEEE